MAERFSDDALVLSTVDFGEADRMVTLFTRGHGRLTAFAAGARKSKKRFAGALEVGTHVRAKLVSGNSDTSRLDEVEIVRSFHRVREDLARIARAFYCVELCRELTRDFQPHEALFDALAHYLGLLDDNKAGPTSLIKFELDALQYTGFMPRFSPCARCQQPLGPRPRFDAESGGVVCGPCSTQVPRAVPTRFDVVDALARLQGGERKPMPPELRARSRELLNHFIAHHLGRKLKSVEFMEQVGTD
jgi:DNA repair protein RecO (recombination protein O)